MRLTSKVILGVGTSLMLAGAAVAADKSVVHVAEVPLGNGQVAQVRYVGDVPPKIRFTPIEQGAPIAWIDPSFADFDRMIADMNMRADAMLRQVAAMAQAPGAAGGSVDAAALKNLPAGSVSYSFTSTTGADGCTRTVQTSYQAGQSQPQVVHQASAGCREADRKPVPVSAPAATAPAEVTPVALPPASAKKRFDPKTI